MFCPKCGAKIEANDLHCPKCTAINPNYREFEPGKKKGKSDFSVKIEISKIKAIPKKIIIGGAVACLVIGIAVFTFGKIWSNNLLNPDKVTYSPSGLYSFYDKDKNVNFISGIDVISLQGPISSARTSPNHDNKVALSEDKTLLLYNAENANGIKIASNVESIEAISDTCLYYSVGTEKRLFLYDFSKNENIDIGFAGSDLTFSAGKNVVVGVNSDGELSSYSRITAEQKVLCNIGSDAEIICVADDGSNLFWSTKSGNTYSVYSMKNGAPERVGKITNSEKYSSLYGRYYNNSKSCVIYSANSTQLILIQDDVSNEIVLPGTQTYATMVNANGEYIDSDDDVIHDFYLSVKENKSNDQCALYRLSSDGSLSVIVDNIADTNYELRDNTVYYVNMDGDLYKKELNQEAGDDRITTDVDDIYISPSGKYAYIVKSGGLYYWETSDKEHKLNLISSSFTNEDSVYITNADDTIFYTADQKEITDSYRTHGTLYQYKVGGSAITIISKVLDVLTNDSKYCDAEHPIIRTYVSNEEYDYVVNYGTFVEGEYTTLISNIEY